MLASAVLIHRDAQDTLAAAVLICTGQSCRHMPLQVFVALLRISQPDGRRGIVRQALDVLTPALVRRLPQGENRYPIWIRYGTAVWSCRVQPGKSLPSKTSRPLILAGVEAPISWFLSCPLACFAALTPICMDGAAHFHLAIRFIISQLFMSMLFEYEADQQ